MKRICLISLLLLQGVCGGGAATTFEIIATVTGTNNAGVTNGAYISVNGNQRTFTNNATAYPAILIHATNSIEGNITNAQRNLSLYPELVTGYGAVVSVTNTSTSFKLRGPYGGALAVTLSAGWASVGYTTNLITNSQPILTPYVIQPEWFRTNQQSEHVTQLNTYPTNSLLPGSTVMTNFMDLTRAQAASNKTMVAVTNSGGMSTGRHDLRNVLLSGPDLMGLGTNGQSAIYFAGNGTNVATKLVADADGVPSIVASNGIPYNVVDDLGTPADANLLTWAAVKMVMPSLAAGYYDVVNEWDTIQRWTSGTNIFTQNLRVYAGLYATGAVAQVDAALARVLTAGRADILGTNATASGITNAHLVSPRVDATNLLGRSGWTSNMVNEASTNRNMRYEGQHSYPAMIGYPFASITSVADGHNRLNLGSNYFHQISAAPTAAWRLGGIVADAPLDGETHVLYFSTPYPVTIVDESGDESTSHYRIDTLNGGNTTSSGGYAIGMVTYDQGAERWLFSWLNRGAGTANGGGANAKFWSAASDGVAITLTNPPATSVTNVLEVYTAAGVRTVAVDNNGLWLAGLDTTFTNVTTDATVTTLGALTIPNNFAVRLDVRVVGYAPGYTNVAAYGRSGAFFATNSTARLVGSVITALGDSEDIAGWDATLDVSGQTARVRVTGAGGTTVKWSAVVRAVPQLW